MKRVGNIQTTIYDLIHHTSPSILCDIKVVQILSLSSEL